MIKARNWVFSSVERWTYEQGAILLFWQTELVGGYVGESEVLSFGLHSGLVADGGESENL